MDAINIVELLGQGGVSLAVGVIAIKMVTKMYNDIREDGKEREEKLMIHLEKVAETLEKIDDRLSKLEQRG
jgi:Mg2+ and Co2+ transporter CorA